MYTPIDYSKFDLSGKGKNILPMLSPLELEIWNMAFPFQDKRDDIGHAEFTTYFALQLLGQVKAERKVVVPAAILHDIGYRISPAEFRRIFVEKDKIAEKQIRLEHQVIGAAYAFDSLHSIGYAPEHTAEVMRIIVDHDTRILPTTSNGKLMQDADILWRFTVPHARQYPSIVGTTPKANLEFMEGQLNREGSFNFPTSREIAKTELVNTLLHCYPKEAETILKSMAGN